MTNKYLIDLLTAGGQSGPQAADELDRTVERILSRLKNGEVVSLPGLGRLVPERDSFFRFEKSSVMGRPGRVRK
ncbi:hypothetical protein [Paludibaculum fermentans]|uniref:hypothetical protein n=1 Tax=Paludibaculum fermentans TaxID=1473598 RepID=UPI003EB82FFE